MSAPPNRITLLLGIIAALLGIQVLLGVFFVVKLNAPRPAPRAAVQSPMPPPFVPVQPATPVRSTQWIAPPSMPVTPISPVTPVQNDYADVADYIKFVRQVEATKQNLIQQQLRNTQQQQAEMAARARNNTANAEEDDAAMQQATQRSNAALEDWNKLVQVFDARMPPAPCTDLHSRYIQSLSAIRDTYSEISRALNMANNGQSGDALNVLKRMQNADSQTNALAREADDALARLCAKYGIEKTFRVTGG